MTSQSTGPRFLATHKNDKWRHFSFTSWTKMPHLGQQLGRYKRPAEKLDQLRFKFPLGDEAPPAHDIEACRSFVQGKFCRGESSKSLGAEGVMNEVNKKQVQLGKRCRKPASCRWGGAEGTRLSQASWWHE